MSYERVMNGPDQKYVQEAISVWSNFKKSNCCDFVYSVHVTIPLRLVLTNNLLRFTKIY